MEILTEILIVIVILSKCGAFNLESRLAVVFDDPQSEKSNFGYTLSFWKQSVNGEAKSWLLVGAPNGTSHGFYKTKQFGAIYNCSFNSGIAKPKQNCTFNCHTGEAKLKQNCSPLFPDLLHSTMNWTAYKRQYAMFGSTLIAENRTDGSIIVCGPLVHPTKSHFLQGETVRGMCFLIETDKMYGKRYYEIMNPKESGDAEFGNAASIVQNPSRNMEFLIGSPLTVSDRVDLFTLDRGPSHSRMAKPTHTYKFISKYIKYDSYFGFCITSGRFRSHANDISYIISKPLAQVSTDPLKLGVVFVFNGLQVHSSHELKSNLIGEFFGFSLLVIDLNFDGEDDLVIVGAPHYHKDAGTNQGCIYVYNGKVLTEAPQKYTGSSGDGAMFGYSLAVAGDLNQDGFNDLAVGAPFEGEPSAGAVYIYHGQKQGLKKTYGQKILATHVRMWNLAGFGFSIHGGVDVDGNGVVDLAVGSAMSNNAVVIRSYPVIYFKSRLVPQVDRLDINTTDFSVYGFLSYTHIDHNVKEILVEAWFKLDPKMNRTGGPNMVCNFSRDGRCIFYMTPNKEFRIEVKVHLTDAKGKFEVPIEVIMNYQPVRNPLLSRDSQFCSTCPVTDPNSPKSTSISVPFAHGCQEEYVCRSDLRVEAKIRDGGNQLILGTSIKRSIEIVITNHKDPAYLTKLYINMPKKKMYLKMPSKCEDSDSSAYIIVCNIGNPLNSHSEDNTRYKVNVSLDFDLQDLGISETLLAFNFTTNSTSEEINPKDNTYQLNVTLKLECSLHIYGSKEGENRKIKNHPEVNETGIVIVHTYDVSNAGPSPVENVTGIFKIPVEAMVNNRKERLVVPSSTFVEVRTKSYSFPCTFRDKTTEVTDMSDKGGIDKLTEKENVTILNCSGGSVACAVAVCPISTLTPEMDRVYVHVSFVVDTAVLRSLMSDILTVQIFTEGNITIANPSQYLNISKSHDTSRAFTEFKGDLPEEETPLWVFIVATLIGILLLAMAVALLNKVGFFKRGDKEKLLAMKDATATSDSADPAY